VPPVDKYNCAFEETVAMIRAKTCFVAEGVTTDRDTGQVSAFRLVQNLRSAAYPCRCRSWLLLPVGAYRADPSRSRTEFSITLDGRDITRQAVDIDFGQHLMSCCTIWVADLELGAPGHVVFQAEVPGHGAAEWALDASVVSGAARSRPHVAQVYDFGPVSIGSGNA
jgi:hypothetical protein